MLAGAMETDKCLGHQKVCGHCKSFRVITFTQRVLCPCIRNSVLPVSVADHQQVLTVRGEGRRGGGGEGGRRVVKLVLKSPALCLVR